MESDGALGVAVLVITDCKSATGDPLDLLAAFCESEAGNQGLVGMEGKDYVVQDGDVILFRFNV